MMNQQGVMVTDQLSTEITSERFFSRIIYLKHSSDVGQQRAAFVSTKIIKKTKISLLVQRNVYILYLSLCLLSLLFMLLMLFMLLNILLFHVITFNVKCTMKIFFLSETRTQKILDSLLLLIWILSILVFR